MCGILVEEHVQAHGYSTCQDRGVSLPVKRPHGGAAGRQMFERFPKLHIEEPGRNWFHSLCRVLQAFHDFLMPRRLCLHRILFLRD